MENDINNTVKVFLNWLKISHCDSFRAERGPNGHYYLTPFNTQTKQLVHEKEMLASEEEYLKIRKATTKQLFAVVLYYDPFIHDVSQIIRGLSVTLGFKTDFCVSLFFKSLTEGTIRLMVGQREEMSFLYSRLIEFGVPVTFELFEE